VNNDSEAELTVREAARLCGRNPETIRRWIWDGKLPARKLGNQLYVARDEVARLSQPKRGARALDQHDTSRPRLAQPLLKASSRRRFIAVDQVHLGRAGRDLELFMARRIPLAVGRDEDKQALRAAAEVGERIYARRGYFFNAAEAVRRSRRGLP